MPTFHRGVVLLDYLLNELTWLGKHCGKILRWSTIAGGKCYGFWKVRARHVQPAKIEEICTTQPRLTAAFPLRMAE